MRKQTDIHFNLSPPLFGPRERGYKFVTSLPLPKPLEKGDAFFLTCVDILCTHVLIVESLYFTMQHGASVKNRGYI